MSEDIDENRAAVRHFEQSNFIKAILMLIFVISLFYFQDELNSFFGHKDGSYPWEFVAVVVLSGWCYSLTQRVQHLSRVVERMQANHSQKNEDGYE